MKKNSVDPALLAFTVILLCGCSANRTERNAASQAEEVRQQVKELEYAWNRGDVRAVIRQYSPSVFVRVGSEHWEYEREINDIEKGMKTEPRPRLKIEISFIQPLGLDYAVVDGSFHMVAQGGTDGGGRFTAVWQQSNGHWQCIYTRS